MEFIDDIIRDFVHGFTQTWIGRTLMGGLYARINGEWREVYVFMIAKDGSRYLRYTQCDGVGVSFHETHMSIEKLEDHT